MRHETLADPSPVIEPRGWRLGDTVVLLAVLGYAAFNVMLLLRYANNMLGPVPFDLLTLFSRVSVLGVIAAFPIQLALRRAGVTWRSALAAAVCFMALTVFNVWCAYSASAAV